nr:hypothetical protein [Tanacetum cinerariifolium]
MKRKRRAELIHEVFFKEDIVVDGMHRNSVPLTRVVGSPMLVIVEPKAGIFVYNRSFDLVFRIENEFQNANNVNLEIAQDIYNKMIFVIEVREDVVEAKKIVQDNLDNLG